ncbi:MAG: CpsD/CapB family tyrosine-protein kinase [Deltaproteobacteria bacterium]|nr:CpsD/CapB family tyrosine-protein kinase [Deltaproteobacteria bacterium]
MGKVFNALKKAGEEAVVTRKVDSVVSEEVVTHDVDTVTPEQQTVANEKKEKSSRQHSSEGKKEKKAAPLIAPLNLERGDWDERLTMATALTGPVAESFRTLRTRILHLESGKAVKNVLVTSAVPGEGKSFVCANLGLSFAQGLDQHGLLVDCDLRKPSLGKLFGLSNKRGLVNYLRDNEDLSSLIKDVGVDKLRVISAGPPAVNPAELLGSDTMEKLIEELGSRYDDRMVLFDSPPLQAASETVILAKHVDAVVLVVRWGASRREHVKSLVELFGREKIVGVVFNAYRSNILDNKIFGSYENQYDYYGSDN